MQIDHWIMFAISGVVVPTVGWLVKEVLALRKEMVKIQTQHHECNKSMREAIERQEASTLRQQETLERLDRNIVRLCENSGTKFDAP